MMFYGYMSNSKTGELQHKPLFFHWKKRGCEATIDMPPLTGI